jgi:hypothetical protein
MSSSAISASRGSAMSPAAPWITPTTAPAAPPTAAATPVAIGVIDSVTLVVLSAIACAARFTFAGAFFTALVALLAVPLIRLAIVVIFFLADLAFATTRFAVDFFVLLALLAVDFFFIFAPPRDMDAFADVLADFFADFFVLPFFAVFFAMKWPPSSCAMYYQLNRASG